MDAERNYARIELSQLQSRRTAVPAGGSWTFQRKIYKDLFNSQHLCTTILVKGGTYNFHSKIGTAKCFPFKSPRFESTRIEFSDKRVHWKHHHRHHLLRLRSVAVNHVVCLLFVACRGVARTEIVALPDMTETRTHKDSAAMRATVEKAKIYTVNWVISCQKQCHYCWLSRNRASYLNHHRARPIRNVTQSHSANYNANHPSASNLFHLCGTPTTVATTIATAAIAIH